MIIDVLMYKGFHGTVRYDAESMTLVGKISGINDLVTFETDDPKAVRTEFEKAVNDYLAFCKDVGKKPEKEYKGSFNVRIPPELHKRLALKAEAEGESLNKTVEHAIRKYIMP